MDEELLFQLVEDKIAREQAQLLFDRVYAALDPILPEGTEIRHIGATAVPGCITKGDLDIVIRVPKQSFLEADDILASRYHRNYGSIKTHSFSAFQDPSASPHLGIQLTEIGGSHDFFHLFVEALCRSSDLLQEYNKLKHTFIGKDMSEYRLAKDKFIESVLCMPR